MTWFRVDDGFHSHPKAVIAGTPAVGLWTLCGSWSADQEKDGFVPTAIALRYGTRTMCKALVSSGLWLEVPGGYQFHDWNHRNPLKADLDAIRETKRKAGQAGGVASGRARAGKQNASSNEAPCFPSGSEAANTQSRPGPVVGGSLRDGPELVDAGEDPDHRETEQREQLALVVQRLQPAWRLGKIRQAIHDARQRNIGINRLTAAMLVVAVSEDSQSPRRVLSDGFWWDENDTRYLTALASPRLTEVLEAAS